VLCGLGWENYNQKTESLSFHCCKETPYDMALPLALSNNVTRFPPPILQSKRSVSFATADGGVVRCDRRCTCAIAFTAYVPASESAQTELNCSFASGRTGCDVALPSSVKSRQRIFQRTLGDVGRGLARDCICPLFSERGKPARGVNPSRLCRHRRCIR